MLAAICVGDVLPGHADFPAVQWWGSLGGFHGLAPKPAGGLLGPTIEGQHSEGWLNHAADLDTVLDSRAGDMNHHVELGGRPRQHAAATSHG